MMLLNSACGLALGKSEVSAKPQAEFIILIAIRRQHIDDLT